MCKNIKINLNYQNWDFNCFGVLDDKIKQLSYFLEDTLDYNITIVSDSNPEYHTKSPIFIQIEGDKDKTELMVPNLIISYYQKKA